MIGAADLVAVAELRVRAAVRVRWIAGPRAADLAAIARDAVSVVALLPGIEDSVAVAAGCRSAASARVHRRGCARRASRGKTAGTASTRAARHGGAARF